MSSLSNSPESLSDRLVAEIRAYRLLAPLLLRLLAPLLRLLAALDSLFARFRAGTLPVSRPRTSAPRPQTARTRTRAPAAPRLRTGRRARKPAPAPTATRPSAGWTTQPNAPARARAIPPRPRCRDSPRPGA